MPEHHLTGPYVSHADSEAVILPYLRWKEWEDTHFGLYVNNLVLNYSSFSSDFSSQNWKICGHFYSEKWAYVSFIIPPSKQLLQRSNLLCIIFCNEGKVTVSRTTPKEKMQIPEQSDDHALQRKITWPDVVVQQSFLHDRRQARSSHSEQAS